MHNSEFLWVNGDFVIKTHRTTFVSFYYLIKDELIVVNYSFINCKISLQLRRRGSRHKCAPERRKGVYVDEWLRHVTIFDIEGVLAISYWEIYVFHKTQGFWEIFDRFYLQIKPDGFVDQKSVFCLNLLTISKKQISSHIKSFQNFINIL